MVVLSLPLSQMPLYCFLSKLWICCLFNQPVVAVLEMLVEMIEKEVNMIFFLPSLIEAHSIFCSG